MAEIGITISNIRCFRTILDIDWFSCRRNMYEYYCQYVS